MDKNWNDPVLAVLEAKGRRKEGKNRGARSRVDNCVTRSIGKTAGRKSWPEEADRLSRLRWLAREFFFSSTPFTSTTRRRLRFRDESTHGANVKSLRETLPLQQDYL